jgi:hypothetical protein
VRSGARSAQVDGPTVTVAAQKAARDEREASSARGLL